MSCIKWLEKRKENASYIILSKLKGRTSFLEDLSTPKFSATSERNDIKRNIKDYIMHDIAKNALM